MTAGGSRPRTPVKIGFALQYSRGAGEGGPRAPHHRAAPEARPVRHRQPARQRGGGSGVAARAARGRRLYVRAACRRPRPPQPDRPAALRIRRAGAVPARPRRHRARRPGRVERRPLVGRAARRLPVGSRRARHEEPGRRRGGRRDRAGRGGLAARVGRADAGLHRRRGDRRRRGRPVALPRAPRPRALRHGRQRGRRRRAPLRRPAGLLRLRRREGRLPLHAHHRRSRRPCLGAAGGRQRAGEDGPAARGAAHAASHHAPDARARGAHPRARPRPLRPGGGPAGDRRRGPARRRSSWSRCSASAWRRRSCAPGRRST